MREKKRGGGGENRRQQKDFKVVVILSAVGPLCSSHGTLSLEHSSPARSLSLSLPLCLSPFSLPPPPGACQMIKRCCQRLIISLQTKNKSNIKHTKTTQGLGLIIVCNFFPPHRSFPLSLSPSLSFSPTPPPTLFILSQ